MDRTVTELDHRIVITLRGLIEALYGVQGIENRSVPIERVATQVWAVLAHHSAVAALSTSEAAPTRQPYYTRPSDPRFAELVRDTSNDPHLVAEAEKLLAAGRAVQDGLDPERLRAALVEIAEGTEPDRIGRYEYLRDWVHKTATNALRAAPPSKPVIGEVGEK